MGGESRSNFVVPLAKISDLCDNVSQSKASCYRWFLANAKRGKMDIREQVAQRIAESGPAIAERVIAALTEELRAKRTKQILDAFTELDGLRLQLKKAKPDVLAYNEAAEVVSANFSKQRIEERAKLTKRINRIEAALAKALENNDFADLSGLGGAKDKAQPDGEADDAS
jgi:hypothetical protein